MVVNNLCICRLKHGYACELQDFQKACQLVNIVITDCLQIAKQFDAHSDLKQLLANHMADIGGCKTKPRIPAETRFGGNVILLGDVLNVWEALQRATLSDLFRQSKYTALPLVQVFHAASAMLLSGPLKRAAPLCSPWSDAVLPCPACVESAAASGVQGQP